MRLFIPQKVLPIFGIFLDSSVSVLPAVHARGAYVPHVHYGRPEGAEKPVRQRGEPENRTERPRYERSMNRGDRKDRYDDNRRLDPYRYKNMTNRNGSPAAIHPSASYTHSYSWSSVKPSNPAKPVVASTTPANVSVIKPLRPISEKNHPTVVPPVETQQQAAKKMAEKQNYWRREEEAKRAEEKRREAERRAAWRTKEAQHEAYEKEKEADHRRAVLAKEAEERAARLAAWRAKQAAWRAKQEARHAEQKEHKEQNLAHKGQSKVQAKSPPTLNKAQVNP